MFKIDIITIFPEAFSSYFSESIIKRAVAKKLVNIKIHNLRDFCNDSHKTVDDRPYGGGPGMIFKVEPILKAVNYIIEKNKGIRNKERKIILLSAKGKIFNQKESKKLSKLKQIILIAGHYEGVDERVAKYIANEEISIGQYVLTGGELPVMAIADSVIRLIPGVIEKKSLGEESFSKKENYLEYPQYTRPEVFDSSRIIKDSAKFPKSFRKAELWKVPKILLSGHHQKIKEWREKKSSYLEK